MAWLHTWVGLMVGWLLFTIFITGSATYYRTAITHWMQADTTLGEATSGQQNAPDTLVRKALAVLASKAPDASRWMIELPGPRGGAGRIAWQSDKGRRFQSMSLSASSLESSPPSSPAAKAPPPRDTAGGDFFYNFHYQLYYLPPLIGRWIVSFCAMFMLVAIVSGVITHRRIFTDFFTFRPGKGQRSWLDAHNISAVLALPYHLMITYTGLATLMLTLMPWGIATRYQGPNPQQQFIAQAYDFAPPAKALGRAAPLTDVPPLLHDATTRLSGSSPGRIWIDRPGDAAARIKFTRGSEDRLSVSPESVTFDGVTGKLIGTHLHNGPASTTTGVMFGIHEAAFAPPVLRGFFFLSGLTGALMVATGLVMWAAKYRQKQARRIRVGFGTRLVEHLNLATLAGLPIAVGGYFWANRLLPPGLDGRGNWETRMFFAAWILAALHPFIRRGRPAWIDQLLFAAGLFGLLPLLDWLTIGEWVLPAFDVVCFGLAILLAVIAYYVKRHRPRVKNSHDANLAARDGSIAFGHQGIVANNDVKRRVEGVMR